LSVPDCELARILRSVYSHSQSAELRPHLEGIAEHSATKRSMGQACRGAR